ncbi:MAG: haloacid dehalogenase-like hydrolase [Deltaproteobacteria bacterium]|nr:haloacid dehalogenase-like hydrolase [Deltaproteobacteria bacterium]
MKLRSLLSAAAVQAILVVVLLSAPLRAAEPLPSWRAGPAKARIIAFVHQVCDRQSPEYVRPADRIAVFDNDGTMWCEKPLYFQLLYVFHRIGELAPRHPEWKTTQPFKAVIENDRQALRASGVRGLMTLMAATHAGISENEFAASVERWAAAARHPRFHRPFTALVFQPMLELLAYLRAHDFTCFIVSGGGIDFMRVLLPSRYGIPPWRIIGSYSRVRFAAGEILRLPENAFTNNGPNKPIAIYRRIGKRPILACGNSDGDLAMLQYAAAGRGPSLELLVHHTDAEREYAYDRQSRVGTLDKGLDYARVRNWLVVDMKKDWKKIFAAAGTGAVSAR